MNPLRKPLGRLEYFIWSVVLAVVNFVTLIEIVNVRNDLIINYWLLGVLAFIAAIEITVFVIVTANRLRDAGYNRWLSLLVLAPYIGFPFVWIVILLLPAHKKVT